MIISHPFQFIYVAVPKTASISIKDILVSKYDGQSYGNAHNVVIPTNCIHYYNFCTVRHPYTRAYSLYNFICRNQNHRCHEIAKTWSWEGYMEWLANPQARPVVPISMEDLRNHETASEWERLIIEDSILRLRGRDANQVDFLSYFLGINYLNKVDYIIRMEELEEGFNELPFVTEKVEMPWKNASRRNVSWRKCMNRRIEELIYQWAQPDFEAFKYERETF